VFNYLIRVQLPDRPGALGAVASRVGSVGGDVISIDILERERGIVVDELGVGLAADDLIGLLRDEILEVDGVIIESIRPVEGPLPDRDMELLGMASELLGQTSTTELLELLVSRVRRSMAATFAVVFEHTTAELVIGDGEQPGPDELCAIRAAAELDAAEPFSVDRADEAADSALSEETRAGPATGVMAGAGLVLAVGRQVPVLRRRERRWIAAMAELADHGWQQLG